MRGSSISADEIALLAVVALQQLGDDERIGEQLTLEILLIDDRVELVGVDTRGAFEGQQHLVVVRPGLDPERRPAADRRVAVECVVDLRLQVAVGHQPLAQRFGAVVGALLVEHAAMPLRADLVLDRLRRHRALEPAAPPAGRASTRSVRLA